MKIENYSIQTNAAHRMESIKEVSETLEITVGQNSTDVDSNEQSFIVNIMSSEKPDQLMSYLNKESVCSRVEDYDAQIKLKLIEYFIYQMSGKHVKLQVPSMDIDESEVNVDIPRAGDIEVAQERDGWGLVYEYQVITAETENVKYEAAGYVKISDGRTISFDMNLNMSRAFYLQSNLSIRMGDAAKVDPLVVVFDKGAPTLSHTKHAFDLDNNGQKENISFATQNSGFLALDKNGDNEINNGAELFGPNSGDGFKELRVYDVDNNGWIDEADPVYSRLSILTLSENGDKANIRLGDVGIGAIFLNDITTKFSYKDEKGEYGEMKSSSVFLKEDGSVGTVHHIDLAL